MPTRRTYLKAALAAPVVGGILGGANDISAAGSIWDPATPRIPQSPFLFGLHVAGSSAAQISTALHLREGQVGRAADVVLLFARIGDPVSNLVPALMTAGYEVVLCLEWWDRTNNPRDPRYSLAQIAAGAYDTDTLRWATWISTLPRPLHVRPLHEGNADWYPWGSYSGLNTPSQFAPAFRRVAQIFRTGAGTKARIQWCVNRKNGRDRPDSLASMYAGDDLVDEFVVNGYDRPEYPVAIPFAELFGPFHAQFKAINNRKPFWIGETSATESHGGKAGWIRAVFDTVRTNMVIDCLTWFDERIAPSTGLVRDWTLDTSPAALAAFAAGISTGRGVL